MNPFYIPSLLSESARRVSANGIRRSKSIFRYSAERLDKRRRRLVIEAEVEM